MSQDTEKAFEALLKRHLSDDRTVANVSTECPDENMVSAYLEGALAEDFRANFEKHASSCVRCQKELSLLVKSQDAAPASSASAWPLRVAKSDWLATLQAGLTWLSNAGPKPVLAVLAVMLVSGYVGVELFQREWQRRETATEVARTIPQDRSVTEEDKHEYSVRETENRAAEAKPAPPEGANEKLRENQEGYLNKAKKAVGADASVAPPNDALSKDANQEKLLRDTYSPVPAESSEADKTLHFGSRSGSLARQPAAARLPEAPSPEPSSTVVRRDSTDAKAPEQRSPGSKKTVATISAAPENQPVLMHGQRAVAVEAQASTNVRDKEDFVKKQANAQDLSASRATTRKLKQEASAKPKAEGAAGPPADEEPRQLRVAEKVFELRNNVWTDLSIKESDARQVDVFLYKNSSNYREQVKSLSAYDSVLSRDEECLIEYQGKIYHIKNSR